MEWGEDERMVELKNDIRKLPRIVNWTFFILPR